MRFGLAVPLFLCEAAIHAVERCIAAVMGKAERCSTLCVRLQWPMSVWVWRDRRLFF